MLTKLQIVLLVGGFGDNEFLYKRLEESSYDVPVQRPTRAYVYSF
jgi:hypothetical protein